MKLLLKSENIDYNYIDATKNTEAVEKRGLEEFPVFDFIKDGKIIHTEYKAIERSELRELLKRLDNE